MSPDVAAESEVPLKPTTHKPRIFRTAFSFPVLLATLLTLLAVFTIRSRFDNPDLWWHLKTGEIIWNTHSIPMTDQFSFTTNNHAYVPHEWLSQATIYVAWKLGGYTGLMLWFCATTSLILISSYILSSLYSGNAKVALIGGLVTWFFSTAGTAIRPQTIGFLFLVCELLIIHLGRSRTPRWFFVLPPLFALWVNCHGSFFLGLLVLTALLFCSFLNLRVGFLTSQRSENRELKTMAMALGLSLAALFLNPVGWHQVTYPLNTLFSQHLGLSSSEEWQSLPIAEARGIACLAIAGLILLIPALRFKELYLSELLLMVLGLALALPHRRMVFVFGILAAPILTRLVADYWDRYEPERDHFGANAVLITLAAALLFVAFPSKRNLEEQVEKSNPVKAVDFIRHSQLSGNMLNEYVYGGYLIWALPEHKVFVDGRGDVFEWAGVLADFGQWATLQADPAILLDKYRVSFCFLSRNAPMSHVLPLLTGWKQVYGDEISVIFTRGDAWKGQAPRKTQTAVHSASTGVDSLSYGPPVT